MIKKIEKIFKNKAIDLNGIFAFCSSDAIELIYEAKKQGIPLLGIDAFWIGQDSLQPSMEHSYDYSSEDSEIEPEGAHDHAITLIKNFRKYGLFFEITLDENLR